MALAGCVEYVATHAEASYHAFAPPAATIEMHNTAGSITVEPWNKPNVEIDAQRRAPTAGDARAIAITVTHSDSRLVITSEFGTNYGGRDVLYTIHAPPTAALDLHQTAGTITVDGWSGSVDIGQTAGNTTVVLARLDEPQHVSVHSTAGNVAITVPASSSAAFDASVFAGKIGGSLGWRTEKKIPGMKATAIVGKGAAPVEIDATTGDITVDSR